MNVAVAIPAYRPGQALVELIRALGSRPFAAIVVVDDGSGPAFHELFQQVAALPNVRLLRHDRNLGKGAALKTAMAFLRTTFPDLAGVITADADGQHHPDDIEQVAHVLEERPQALVLGARSFRGAVPLRSRIGNTLSRWVVRAVVGHNLVDTQTGLRGIPAALLPRLLEIASNGYEFELEMLIAARQLSIPVAEVPIRTIYEPGNLSSHFNPLVDSMKIYFILLRFTSVSLMTAVLDNVVFYLAYRQIGHVLAAQVLGRVMAVAFNYVMVRRSVFYSKQRHREVFPKYLGLVVCSGALSYGGIQLLSAKAGMHPVIAKLLVETALFFANFAIQRLFIFNPVEERAAPVIRRREVIALVVLILAAVAAIELYGFATSHLFAQDIWFPLGMRRFHRYAGLFLEAGLPLLVMFPWLFSGAVAFLALAGTALAAPMGLLSAACVLWSAWTLGSRIIRGAAAAPATLLGIAVYVFLMGGVARLPVNYPVVWACVLAIPIVLEPRRAWHGVRALAARIAGTELRAPTERAALALLVFVMGMHWLVVLKPEAGADSLAMHLAIPANIAVHHRMTYEPTLFLWSVMPMGADWAFSIAYLFGGELASRLLNFAMLLLLLAMLYQAVRRWVSRPLAFLLLALFAATPVIQYVTGALYVENFLAAMLFGAAKALWQFAEGGDRRLLHLAAVLCGTALATKVGAFAFLLLLLPFAIQAARRHRLRLGAGAVAVVLLLAVGLPSYLVAWRKTGNPVFPFYNQRIPSPVLDRSVVIVSPFHQPLNWKTPYNLTFRTSDFYEGQNGSFGFHYLLLAPLALACLLIDRKRPLAIAATAGFGAIVIVLATEPNVRYVYAALPFLFVPFSATLAWVQSNQRALFRALIACLLACLVLNIYFLPASNWYHKEFYSQEVFMPHGRDRLIRGDLPLRDVVRHFAREHPGRAVLFTSDNDLADVSATAYENNWHQVGTFNRLQAAASRPDMLKLLREWNVEYLIGNAPQPDAPVSPPALQDLLDHCALPEYENHWFFLAKVDPTCTDRTMPLLQPAVYDDFDMAVLFRGDWRRTQHFAEPIRGTLTYADAPGAEASVTFEGRGLTYIFSKQPDRGMAEILIDGAVRATVDLYSPQIEWQRAYRVCCLAYGRHMATIRVLGQSRAGAAGRIVDVDGVAVE